MRREENGQTTGDGTEAAMDVTWFPAREFLLMSDLPNGHSSTARNQNGSASTPGADKKPSSSPSYIGLSILANGYRLRSRTPDVCRLVHSVNAIPRSRCRTTPKRSSQDFTPPNEIQFGACTPVGREISGGGSRNATFPTYSFELPTFSIDERTADGNAYKRMLHNMTHTLRTYLEGLGHVLTSEQEMPESISEDIRVAIGRTELLLRVFSKRLRQFETQLDRHLNPVAGEKPTKIQDLHGLFSLVDMQIEDIRKCFERVERARLNNWT